MKLPEELQPFVDAIKLIDRGVPNWEVFRPADAPFVCIVQNEKIAVTITWDGTYHIEDTTVYHNSVSTE